MDDVPVVVSRMITAEEGPYLIAVLDTSFTYIELKEYLTLSHTHRHTHVRSEMTGVYVTRGTVP